MGQRFVIPRYDVETPNCENQVNHFNEKSSPKVCVLKKFAYLCNIHADNRTFRER
jgi:hypothetical protein